MVPATTPAARRPVRCSTHRYVPNPVATNENSTIALYATTGPASNVTGRPRMVLTTVSSLRAVAWPTG